MQTDPVAFAPPECRVTGCFIRLVRIEFPALRTERYCFGSAGLDGIVGGCRVKAPVGGGIVHEYRGELSGCGRFAGIAQFDFDFRSLVRSGSALDTDCDSAIKRRTLRFQRMFRNGIVFCIADKAELFRPDIVRQFPADKGISCYPVAESIINFRTAGERDPFRFFQGPETENGILCGIPLQNP